MCRRIQIYADDTRARLVKDESAREHPERVSSVPHILLRKGTYKDTARSGTVQPRLFTVQSFGGRKTVSRKDAKNRKRKTQRQH